MAGLGRRSHYRKHLTDAVLNDFPEPDAEMGDRVAKVVGTRGGNMFDLLVAPETTTTTTTSSRKNDEVTQTQDPPAAARNLPHDTNKRKDPQMNANTEESLSTILYQDQSKIESLTPQLAILPTKFRKLVWVKRNDYVIVSCGDEPNNIKTQEEEKDIKPDTGGGVRYLIKHILYKDQVKHLKEQGLWPDMFRDSRIDAEHAATVDDEELLKTKALAIAEREKQRHEELRAKNDNNDDDDSCSEEEEDCNEESDRCDTINENGGIVFDNPGYDDDYYLNTNRIAMMKVDDDSDSDSEQE